FCRLFGSFLPKDFPIVILHYASGFVQTEAEEDRPEIQCVFCG
ncbi:unnamed protein product, partial [marine sediment metagenome]